MVTPSYDSTLRGQRSKCVIFSKCYFSFKLHGMVMWLMLIDQLDTLYKSYGSKKFTWGHLGSQGSKGFFSPKMLFLLQITWYGRGTHAYSSARYHYKRYRSRNSHRVIWGHGVKESFSPKMLFLLQFTWHNNETQAHSSTWHSLQKLRVWKFTRGHLWSQGSNGNFQQNMV